jgi:hypothetical protein
MVHFAYAKSHSRGAGIRNTRGASPSGFGGPQTPSCVGANIVCEQGKAWFIPPITLFFLLNHYFTVRLVCALIL